MEFQRRFRFFVEKKAQVWIIPAYTGNPKKSLRSERNWSDMPVFLVSYEIFPSFRKMLTNSGK